LLCRSEEDYGGPIPLRSSRVAEALHHSKAQWSLHVPSAVILSVFALFSQCAFVSYSLKYTDYFPKQHNIVGLGIGHLYVFCETGAQVLCIS